MLYVGIDHHKKFCYGTVMDEKGKIQWSRKFETKKEKVKEVFNGVGKAKAVLEAGRNWAVMYDWLEEMFEEVKLAHPLKVKAIAEAKIERQDRFEDAGTFTEGGFNTGGACAGQRDAGCEEGIKAEDVLCEAADDGKEQNKDNAGRISASNGRMSCERVIYGKRNEVVKGSEIKGKGP